MTLKTRIIVSISGIILLSASVIGGANFVVIRNAQIEKELQLAGREAAESMASVSRIIQHQMSMLRVLGGLSVFQEALRYDFFPDQAIDYCAQMAANDPWVLRAVLVNSGNEVIAAEDIGALGTPHPFGSFLTGHGDQEVFLAGPWRPQGAETGRYLVAATVTNEGGKPGRLVVEYDWDRLLQVVAQEKSCSDNDGDLDHRFLLLDADGVLIGTSFPDMKQAMFSLNLRQGGLSSAQVSVVEGGDSLEERDLVGNHVFTGVSGFPETDGWDGAGWRMLWMQDAATVGKVLEGLGLQVVALSAALVAVGILLAYLLVRQWVARPVAQLVARMERVAAGDLTAEIGETGHDEFGRLNGAVAIMVENLRSLVNLIGDSSRQLSSTSQQMVATSHQVSQGAQIQRQSTSETVVTVGEMVESTSLVSESAERLAAGVQQTFSASHELGTSVEEVAENSDRMAESVERTVVGIGQMAASIEQVARTAALQDDRVGSAKASVEQIAESVQDVVSSVEKTGAIARKHAEVGVRGGEAIRRAVGTLQKMGEAIRNSTEAVRKLGKRSEEIRNIVAFITEIAEKTNLLALNAAILAAQAGEKGRGFAVVADEVGQLANRSMSATKEVGEVIRSILRETSEAVRSAEETLQEAETGSKLAESAGSSIEEILRGINESVELFDHIAGSCQRQKGISNEVVAAMNDLTDIAVGVRTATREQTDTVGQIRTAALQMQSVTLEVSSATKEQARATNQIVMAMGEMNEMTQNVAFAAQMQRERGEGVAESMRSMQEMTEKNVAAVSQLLSAAENLSRQGEGMLQLVARFRT